MRPRLILVIREVRAIDNESRGYSFVDTRHPVSEPRALVSRQVGTEALTARDHSLARNFIMGRYWFADASAGALPITQHYESFLSKKPSEKLSHVHTIHPDAARSTRRRPRSPSAYEDALPNLDSSARTTSLLPLLQISGSLGFHTGKTRLGRFLADFCLHISIERGFGGDIFGSG